jgi:hypothetical protein
MPEHESLWRPCRDGELTGFALQARQRTRRRVRRRGATLLMVLALLGVAIVQWPRAVGAPDLTCREVQNLLAQYVDQTLDRPVAQRVADHLEHCRHCRRRWEEVRDGRAGRSPGWQALAANRLFPAR